MISMIMILNQKGDILISRQYRDDVSRSAADSFRLQVVAAKETGGSQSGPVKRIEDCSFLYTRHMKMYFVAITRSNVNPALVFEYLFQKIKILQAFLGDEFDENSMRNNMTLIYELMDETMDFGYPQNCAIDVLRLYINLGAVKPVDENETSELTSQITGAIDWRREGIRHRKNEVYIDVLVSCCLSFSINSIHKMLSEFYSKNYRKRSICCSHLQATF